MKRRPAPRHVNPLQLDLPALSAHLRPMRLLIVEDSPELHQQLRSGLTEAGFAVDGAMDGQEALQAVRRLEAECGKGCPPVKILMTTGLGDSASVIRAFREQCDGYLTKPIEKAKLAHALSSLGLIS